jgi:hypothetical protein
LYLLPLLYGRRLLRWIFPHLSEEYKSKNLGLDTSGTHVSAPGAIRGFFLFREQNAGGFTMAVPQTHQDFQNIQDFQEQIPSRPEAANRLSINVDLIAVSIALALAVLIRFNLLPAIPF